MLLINKLNFMRKFILFKLIILLGFIACINSEKQKLKEKLNSYIGRNVVLPLTDRSESGKIKIATYINGSCGACVDDIEKWESWIEKDTVMIDYFFYFYAMDSTTFAYVKSEVVDLGYPIIYDQRKAYLKQNDLSEESKLFQTFLLNGVNQVVLVGNPLYNNKLGKLYRQEIGNLAKMNWRVNQ